MPELDLSFFVASLRFVSPSLCCLLRLTEPWRSRWDPPPPSPSQAPFRLFTVKPLNLPPSVAGLFSFLLPVVGRLHHNPIVFSSLCSAAGKIFLNTKSIEVKQMHMYAMRFQIVCISICILGFKFVGKEGIGKRVKSK